MAISGPTAAPAVEIPSNIDNQRLPLDHIAMNVSLPTLLEEFVRDKVAAGEFHSTDEVVCEGLRLLQRQESWKADARAKIHAGWEQAHSDQLRSPEEVTENLSSRKRDWQRGRPG
jgi:putative addiction module CopG family antidote